LAWLDFRALGLAANGALFLLAAGAVWWAGDRLARQAQLITERTALGQAVVGTLLLGVLVSLPELTLAVVAAAVGNAGLAVNTLIGGAWITLVMLAMADLTIGRFPLSGEVRHPVVMLQGGLSALLLTLIACAILGGDRLLPGAGVVGLWPLALIVLYAASVVLVRRVQDRSPWTPSGEPAEAATPPTEAGKAQPGGHGAIVRATVGASAVVLVAGSVLAFTADAITELAGLTAGLAGLLLGGLSTSLPELSTTVTAARLKQYDMALSAILGSNMCSAALIFFADVAHPGGPILAEVGTFSAFAVLLAVAMTAVYIAGLVVRETVGAWRVGLDSLAVFLIAVVGMALLAMLA
jgi:cation:H+ antiporter